MKAIIGFVLFIILFTIGGFAQTETSPFAKKPNKKTHTKKLPNFVFKQRHLFPFAPNYQNRTVYEIVPNIDVTIGYIPNSEINAVKNTVAFNNIGYSRIGIFMSFETGWDTDYSTNTVGMTGTVNRFLFLWAGADLLTKQGLLTTKSFNGMRKELGVGLTPYRWVVLRVGYSNSVGYTLELGFRVIM